MAIPEAGGRRPRLPGVPLDAEARRLSTLSLELPLIAVALGVGGLVVGLITLSGKPSSLGDALFYLVLGLCTLLPAGGLAYGVSALIRLRGAPWGERGLAIGGLGASAVVGLAAGYAWWVVLVYVPSAAAGYGV